MEGKKLRMRDPWLVVDEIEYDLSLFPDLREVMFETDTFTASTEHVSGVCEAGPATAAPMWISTSFH
jgi:hypothetical protein